MQMQHIQVWFFFIVILAVLVLNFFIFLPYLSVLFMALVFTIIFKPLYDWILRNISGRGTVSALLTVVIVFLLIVGPIAFFGTLLFQEASALYGSILRSQGSGADSPFFAVIEKIGGIVPGFDIDRAEVDIAEYLKDGLAWIIDHVGIFFGGFVKIAFGLFLMLLALFFFLRDGKKFVDALVTLSPLADSSDRRIAERIVTAVNSVVRGHLVIGILQGLVVGFGFFIFGVPSPVIWGVAAAVASLIPMIGTSLVIIPGILILLLAGSLVQAIGLLIWGIFAVGLIDDLLGPYLIERGIKIHPFLILLSALGGIALLGPVGFLAGPVILALLFALLDLYPTIVKQ